MAWRTRAAEHNADLGEGPDLSASTQPAEWQRPSGVSPNATSRRTRSRTGRMPKIPIAAAAKKLWIVLVVLVVVAVAGFCVYRLRGIFGAHGNHPITSGMADDIKPFNPKHVVYEVYGPPGTTANINYLDINAQPQKASNVPLPWTLSVITTLPSVSVNVVAQGDSDQIGCRIVVNDVVKDERSATGERAQTFCIVKSA